MAWKKNDNWLNGKSYISQDELFQEEYIHIINKLSKVIFDDAYFEDTKIFARSILDFTIDHEFMTWKQANAILKIKTTEERLRLYHSAPSSRRRRPYVYGKGNVTDRELDRLTKQLFGNCYHQEEYEGYVRHYRDDGSRYFAMPTGKERMSDYI